MNLEINKVSDYLKNMGYFTNTIDSLTKHNKKYIAHYSLNLKTENAIIKINPRFKSIFEKLKTPNNTISIKIEELQKTLDKISEILGNKGKSFSKVQLKKISIKNKTLFAELKINESKKRFINKVIIKGYEKFPESFIQNHLNIKLNTIINQEKINEISNTSKGLQFVKEIKPPEILFTKDSTLLYMYLKKHQNNSFDGLVNFTSDENGSVLFNGYIDLKLNNTLNKGEKLELFWNSIGKERQEFKLSTHIPFIFNSKFSPNMSFSIYKQDSTFLSTKSDLKLLYNINTKLKLALTYNSESSQKLKEIATNNIETFKNYFLGFQLQYKIPKNDSFYNDKLYLEINPTFGKRKTNKNSSNQFKLESTASYLWDLNTRNSIFIRTKTGYLNSNNIIDNELFRIGGANSIRGFNEQTIFTDNYTYFNIEYRYLTSEKSYLYTITDFGKVRTNRNNQNLFGLGLGYLLSFKKSRVNINLAINKSQNLDFTNPKIIINFNNYF